MSEHLDSLVLLGELSSSSLDTLHNIPERVLGLLLDRVNRSTRVGLSICPLDLHGVKFQSGVLAVDVLVTVAREAPELVHKAQELLDVLAVEILLASMVIVHG